MQALPPLAMSAEVFGTLALSGHSMHGSPSDWAATIGSQASPGLRFGPSCEIELGHWRRRARPDGAMLRVDTSTPDAAFETAESTSDLVMHVRYTSGDAREGRRRAQLRVRCTLIRAVAHALANFARPWQELPPGRSDFDILENLPPLP
jgi:hypothetical protein